MGHNLLTFWANERVARVLYSMLCNLSHFLAGCITAIVSTRHPLLSALLFLAFIIYEVNEDWHLSDNAYKDIFVYALGLYVTAIFLLN
ncbi:MAG: hypothetical protein DRJ96_03860 [Thermoprotei archaeon]|nr:MAG: hypothetical protein DRJ67_08255 [Thermoprotei archaeon]RLE97458.1 MAG: hypothetical protein DRJ96_03860 [Thermoprotei archaeon]